MALALVAAPVLAAPVPGGEPVDERDVVVLTEANFESTLANAETALVEFYAPWCGHCKHLIEPYAQAATALKGDGVLLAKVDATVESALGTRFGVTGYPTLKIFRNGALASDYNGPRDAAGIAAYMRKQVGPSSVQLASRAAVDAFVAADPATAAVIFFQTAKGSAHSAWAKTAAAQRETFRFGETLDPEALAAYNVTKNTVVLVRPSLYVHSAFDQRFETLNGRFDADELEAFVYANAMPLVSQYVPDRSKIFKSRPLVMAIYSVDFTRDPKGTNFIANRLRKAAAAVKAEYADSDVAFVVAAKGDVMQHVQDFGLTAIVAKHGMDGVGVVALVGAAKYKMAGAFSDAAVAAFAKSVLAGTAEPFVKSEPVPAVNPDENGVTTVVGRNFASVVLDASKDVLIELYAPWCGHCKSLVPIYNELGKKFAGVDSVVIAKMDATANDAQNGAYTANGYPTILFAPAGRKDAPIKFEGERTVEGFAAFIRKNADIKIAKAKKEI